MRDSVFLRTRSVCDGKSLVALMHQKVGATTRRLLTTRRQVLGAIIVAFAASACPAAGITYHDLYTLGTPAGVSNLTVTGVAVGGYVSGYGSVGSEGDSNAVAWSPSTPGGVNLNTTGWGASYAFSNTGTEQIGALSTGYGAPIYGFIGAALWTGTASSAVLLNPDGYSDSYAFATDGVHQVGVAYTSLNFTAHAILWTDTATSAVDLNFGGYSNTSADGVGGNEQVGFGAVSSTNNHALLWTGTASSGVDLNPSNYTNSEALATDGVRQVGFASGTNTSGNDHAILWSATASSAVDLNPTGFTISEAQAVSANYQVGYGSGASTDNNIHALLWSGTAASAFDLQSVLPSSFTSSAAFAISGDTVYGYAKTADGGFDAIEWSVPEPAAAAPLAILTTAGMLIRRRSVPV
jgi:hypothetical protein